MVHMVVASWGNGADEGHCPRCLACCLSVMQEISCSLTIKIEHKKSKRKIKRVKTERKIYTEDSGDGLISSCRAEAVGGRRGTKCSFPEMHADRVKELIDRVHSREVADLNYTEASDVGETAIRGVMNVSENMFVCRSALLSLDRFVFQRGEPHHVLRHRVKLMHHATGASSPSTSFPTSSQTRRVPWESRNPCNEKLAKRETLHDSFFDLDLSPEAEADCLARVFSDSSSASTNLLPAPATSIKVRPNPAAKATDSVFLLMTLGLKGSRSCMEMDT